MGCGCKKKQTQTSTGQVGSVQPKQTNSPTVQESIKKVVEKYYNKK